MILGWLRTRATDLWEERVLVSSNFLLWPATWMWVVHESEMRRYKVPSESRQGSPPVSVLALESPESDQHQISPHSFNP